MLKYRIPFSLWVISVYSLLMVMFGTSYYVVSAATNGSPTAPTNLKAVAHTSNSPRVVISWNQAMDSVGVTRYNIYKNGTFMVSPSGVGVTYTDFNVLVGQSYTYSVQAGDGDGNNGPQSDTVLIIINEGAVSQITSPPSHIEDQVTVPIDIPKTTVYSNVNYNEQATALTPPDTVGLSSFGKELHITWKNPKNSQFRTTRVIKKIGSYPTKITEGTIICDGIKEECVDKDVEQKTTYYYGVYAVDQSFITSQVVTVSGSLVNEMKVNLTSSVTSKITHSTPEALPWGTREVASTPTSGITNTFFFTKTLKLGSTDDDVLFLQKYLNTHGFVISITGGGSKGFETKLFGPATEKALKVYQCSKKIVCEGTPISTGYGMVGKTTRMYLNKKE